MRRSPTKRPITSDLRSELDAAQKFIDGEATEYTKNGIFHVFLGDEVAVSGDVVDRGNTKTIDTGSDVQDLVNHRMIVITKARKALSILVQRLGDIEFIKYVVPNYNFLDSETRELVVLPNMSGFQEGVSTIFGLFRYEDPLSCRGLDENNRIKVFEILDTVLHQNIATDKMVKIFFEKVLSDFESSFARYFALESTPFQADEALEEYINSDPIIAVVRSIISNLFTRQGTLGSACREFGCVDTNGHINDRKKLLESILGVTLASLGTGEGIKQSYRHSRINQARKAILHVLQDELKLDLGDRDSYNYKFLGALAQFVILNVNGGGRLREDILLSASLASRGDNLAALEEYLQSKLSAKYRVAEELAAQLANNKDRDSRELPDHFVDPILAYDKREESVLLSLEQGFILDKITSSISRTTGKLAKSVDVNLGTGSGKTRIAKILHRFFNNPIVIITPVRSDLAQSREKIENTNIYSLDSVEFDEYGKLKAGGTNLPENAIIIFDEYESYPEEVRGQLKDISAIRMSATPKKEMLGAKGVRSIVKSFFDDGARRGAFQRKYNQARENYAEFKAAEIAVSEELSDESRVVSVSQDTNSAEDKLKRIISNSNAGEKSQFITTAPLELNTSIAEQLLRESNRQNVVLIYVDDATKEQKITYFEGTQLVSKNLSNFIPDSEKGDSTAYINNLTRDNAVISCYRDFGRETDLIGTDFGFASQNPTHRYVHVNDLCDLSLVDVIQQFGRARNPESVTTEISYVNDREELAINNGSSLFGYLNDKKLLEEFDYLNEYLKRKIRQHGDLGEDGSIRDLLSAQHNSGRNTITLNRFIKNNILDKTRIRYSDLSDLVRSFGEQFPSLSPHILPYLVLYKELYKISARGLDESQGKRKLIEEFYKTLEERYSECLSDQTLESYGVQARTDIVTFEDLRYGELNAAEYLLRMEREMQRAKRLEEIRLMMQQSGKSPEEMMLELMQRLEQAEGQGRDVGSAESKQAEGEDQNALMSRYQLLASKLGEISRLRDTRGKARGVSQFKDNAREAALKGERLSRIVSSFLSSQDLKDKARGFRAFMGGNKKPTMATVATEPAREIEGYEGHRIGSSLLSRSLRNLLRKVLLRGFRGFERHAFRDVREHAVESEVNGGVSAPSGVDASSSTEVRVAAVAVIQTPREQTAEVVSTSTQTASYSINQKIMQNERLSHIWDIGIMDVFNRQNVSLVLILKRYQFIDDISEEGGIYSIRLTNGEEIGEIVTLGDFIGQLDDSFLGTEAISVSSHNMKRRCQEDADLTEVNQFTKESQLEGFLLSVAEKIPVVAEVVEERRGQAQRGV